MSDFSTGLMISLVGMLITFVALGIFIGLIYLLKALFPFKEKEEGTAVEAPAESAVEAVAGDESDEIAAAVAAVAYLRSRRTGQLGAALLSGPGPFRTSRK